MVGKFRFPCPTTEIPERYLATTIAQAVYRCKEGHPGPVHLNCPFREPLFSLDPLKTENIVPTLYEPTNTMPSVTTLETWAEYSQRTPRGVIVLGSMPPPSKNRADRQACLFAEMANPFRHPIASACSGYTHEVIRHYDALLKVDSSYRPDCVLHLGDRLVSKTLMQWLKSLNASAYFQVAAHPCRQDPDHLVTHCLKLDPSLLCNEILYFIEEQSDSSWFDSWKLPSDQIAENLPP